MTRGVLKLAACIAPYKCCILPLEKRVKECEGYIAMSEALRDELSKRGLSYTEDGGGAAIGRRCVTRDSNSSHQPGCFV